MSELTKNELLGYVELEGRLVFADLLTMGGAPGFAPKYSATVQVGKSDPSIGRLFEVMKHVAAKVWGPGIALERLKLIEEELADGAPLNKSTCSVQDGDVIQPDFNAGTYLVKAARRQNQGQPILANEAGDPIFVKGELKQDISGVASQGDIVMILIHVWAQKKHERINFTVEAVRKTGVSRQLDAGVNEEQVNPIAEAFLKKPLPTSLGAGQSAPQQVAASVETEVLPPEAATEEVAPPTPQAEPKRTSLFGA